MKNNFKLRSLFIIQLLVKLLYQTVSIQYLGKDKNNLNGPQKWMDIASRLLRDEGLIIVVTSVIDATSGGDGNYRRATRLARWTVATIHPAQRRPREMEIKWIETWQEFFKSTKKPRRRNITRLWSMQVIGPRRQRQGSWQMASEETHLTF